MMWHVKVNDLKLPFSFNFILVIIFTVMALISLFSSSVGLIYAIFLTLFLPGFVFINLFFSDLEGIEKVALTFFLSVLFSTNLIYWISVFVGYSKYSIVLAGLLITPIILFISIGKPDLNLYKHPALLLSIGIFAVFTVILSHSIWVFQDEDILLSGSNWQDTPMHLGIIESLNQGNFPPEMPYYSGVKMTYHYFVDFHTAIIGKMADVFNPRLLVYLNSFFAGLFSLSLYILAYYLTKSRRAALLAVVVGVFGGGFSYIRFFEAFSSHEWSRFSDLFLRNYVIEWKEFFQIVPVFELLLQSRPQMIGLPGLTFAAYYLYQGLIEQNHRKLLLSGLITGLLFPFQITAFFSVGLIFLLLIHQKRRFYRKELFFFIAPVLLSLPFLLAIDPANTSRFVIEFGWWAPDKSIPGISLFYLGNFGLPFILAFFFPLFYKKHLFFIYSWILVMFLLPNLVSFTPESYDMHKFFHFMWIPVAVAAGGVLGRIKSRILLLIFIIFIVLTPFLDIAWNLSVHYPAYTFEEYRAGIWIKRNTPQCSVFLEEANIHSPPTQIAGRLRIMGYGTWAHAHGYDIWSRGADIQKAFNGTQEEIMEVAAKYNVSYAYIGKEELRNYPDAKNTFDRYFERVYSDKKGKIWIYKLDQS